jgi:hypothetical protein
MKPLNQHNKQAQQNYEANTSKCLWIFFGIAFLFANIGSTVINTTPTPDNSNPKYKHNTCLFEHQDILPCEKQRQIEEDVLKEHIEDLEPPISTENQDKELETPTRNESSTIQELYR